MEDVSLAYIEEFWEYKRNNNSSLVGSGNLQLYAPQVYHVIPVERILCKADIMRDPVTPRIPAGALLSHLPRNHAQREREYPHAKDGGEVGGAVHCTFTTIGACNGAFIREDRRHRGIHFFEANYSVVEISSKQITSKPRKPWYLRRYLRQGTRNTRRRGSITATTYAKCMPQNTCY